MSNNMTAHSQYSNRPADERFDSLTAMHAAAVLDRARSGEKSITFGDVAIVAGDTGVRLASAKGEAEFTHWSFGQFCREVGAPAAYLRELPAPIVADALNHGRERIAGQTSKLLIKVPETGRPIVRQFSTDKYGRLWDADAIKAIADRFGDGMTSAADSRTGVKGEWQAPATWDGKPAGQYRGDRDMFIVRIDGGSIVGDPRGWGGGGNGRLNRGLMITNSEVGRRSFAVDQVLFDFICGNHIFWGAAMGEQYRRRHVGADVLADALGELDRIAADWSDRPASADEDLITRLAQRRIADDLPEVIATVRRIAPELPKGTITDAIEATTNHDATLDPYSFWGMANGLTRISQAGGHQDDRRTIDLLAASVLRAGRQLVTV